MKMTLVKTFSFGAAHETVIDSKPCLHGHTFFADMIIRGAMGEDTGWIIDYGDISMSFNKLMPMLDHNNLNDVDGMADPGLSGIADWILARMKNDVPGLDAVRIRTSGANTFLVEQVSADDSLGLPRRIRFGFESAHRLTGVPCGHKCNALHGHSFKVDLGGESLDGLAEAAEELYGMLDHSYLNDTPGLENPTSEMLCAWIWDKLHNKVSNLRTVIVAESDTARCIYNG